MEPTGLQQQRFRHSTGPTRLPPKQMAGNIAGKVPRRSSTTKAAVGGSRRSSSGNTTGGVTLVFNNGTDGGNINVGAGAAAGAAAAAGGNVKKVKRRSISGKSHGSGTLSSGNGGKDDTIGTSNGGERPARLRSKGPSSSSLPAADPPGLNVRKLSSSLGHANNHHGEGEGGGRVVVNNTWKRLRRTVKGATKLRAGTSGGGGSGGGNHSRSSNGYSGNKHGGSPGEEEIRLSCEGSSTFTNEYDDDVNGNSNATATTNVTGNHAGDYNNTNEGDKTNPSDAWKRLRHKAHVVRGFRNNSGMRDGGSGESHGNTKIMKANGDIYAIANVNGNGLGSNQDMMVSNKTKEIHSSRYMAAPSPSHERQQQLRNQRQYQLQPPQQLHPTQLQPSRTTIKSNHPRGVLFKSAAPQRIATSTRRIGPTSSSGRSIGRHSQNARQYMSRGNHPNVHKHGQTHRPHHGSRLRSIDKDVENEVKHIKRKITPIDEDKEGVPEEEDDDDEDDDTSTDSNDIDPTYSSHNGVALDQQRTTSSYTSPVANRHKNHGNARRWDEGTPTDQWGDDQDDQFQQQLQDQWRLLHLIQQQMGVEKSPTRQEGEQDEDRAYQELCEQIKILQELQDHINMQKEKDRMDLKSSVETKYPDEMQDSQDWKDRQHIRQGDDGKTELEENNPPKPPFQKSDNDNLTLSTTSTEPPNSQVEDDGIYQVSPEIDDIDESSYPSRSSSPMRSRLSELSHALESDLENSLEVFEDDNDDSTYEKRQRGFASSFPTIPGEGDLDSFLMSDSSGSSDSMSSKSSQPAATVASLSTRSTSVQTCKLSPRTLCPRSKSNSTNNHNQGKLSNEELMKVILDIQTVCNAAKDAVDSDPDTNSRSSDDSSQSSSSASTSVSASSDSSPITDHGLEVETVISDITNFTQMQPFQPGSCEASDLPIPSHIDNYGPSKAKIGAVEFEEMKELERQLRNPVIVPHKTSVYSDSDIESYTDRVVKSMRSNPPLHPGKRAENSPKVSKPKRRKAKKVEKRPKWKSEDNEQDVESYTDRVVTSELKSKAPKAVARSKPADEAPKESAHPTMHIGATFTKGASVYSVESYTDRVVTSMRAPQAKNAAASSKLPVQDRTNHVKETVSSTDPRILRDVESFTDRIVVDPRMPPPFTMNTEDTPQQSTRSENMDKSAALRRRQATECARAPTLASEETFTSRDASTMSLSKTNDQAKDETKFSPEENNLVDHSEAAGVIKRSSHVSNDEDAIRSKKSNSTPEAWQTKATFFEATDEVGDGNEEASKSSTIETLDPSGKLQPKKESFHVSATDEESNSGSRSIQTDPTGALGYRNSFIYKVPKTDKINGLNRSFPQSCILKTPRSDSHDDLKVKNGDVSPKGKSTVNDDAIRSTKDCDYACKKHIVGTHRNPSLLQTTVAQNGSDQDTIQHSVEQMMDQGRRLKHKNKCENTSYIHKLISTGPPPLGHHGQNDSTRRFTMSESSGASMQSSTDNLDKTIYEPRQVDDTKFLELCNQWKMAHTALQYALGDENYSKHQLPNTNGSPHPAEELHHPIDESCNFGHHSVSDDKHEADENANHVNVDIDQENEQDAVYIYVKDDVSTTSSKVDGYAGTVISDITSFTQPFFSNSYNGYRIPGLGHFNLSNQVPPKSHIIPTPGNPYAGSEDSYPAVANYTQSVDHSANTQQLRFSNPTTSKYTVGEGEIQCEKEIAKIARTILNGKIDNKLHSYNFESSTPQKSQSIGIPGGVNSASNNPENLNSSLNMSEGQLSSISQLLNDIADLSCSNAKISRIQSSLEDARSSDNINKRFQVHNSHNGTANSSGSTRFGDSSLTSHDPGDCGNGSDGVGISCKSSQQRRTGKTDARCEDLSKESIHATSKVHDDEVTETVDKNDHSPPESQISDLATKARDLVVSPDKCGVDYVDRVGEADAVRSSTDLDGINHSHHNGYGNGVDHFDEGSHTNDVESKENMLIEEHVSQTEPLQLEDTGTCKVLTDSPSDSKKGPWPHSEISLPPDEHIRLDEKRTQEFDEAKVGDDGENVFNMDTTSVPTLDESERSNYSMSSGKKESGWARVRQRVTYMDILNRMQAKKDSGRRCNSPVHSIAEEGRHDQVEKVLNEDDDYEENQMQHYSLFSSGRAVETSYDNNGEILGTDDGNPHEEYQAHSADDYGYVDGNSTKPLQHFQSTSHKNEANSYLGAYLEGQHMYGPIYDRDDVSFATLQTMKQLYTQSVGNQESFIAKSRPEHLSNRALYSEKDLAKDISTTNPTCNKQRNSSGSPGPKLSKSSQFSKFSNPSKSSKLAASSKQLASKILCNIPSDSCEHEPETKPATNALPKRSSESSSRMTKSDNNNSFLRQIQHLQREVVDEEVLIASANKITTEKNRDLSSYANGLLDDDIEIKWDELKDPFQNDYELDHFEDEFSAANSFSGSTNSHNSVDSHGTDTSAHKKITSGWAKVREKVTYLDILNKMKVQGDGCTSPVHSVVGSESHRNSSFSDDGSVCNNVDDATSTGSPDSVLSWNQFEADNMQEKNIGEENYSQDDLSTNSDSCWHQEEFKSKLNSSETPCEKVESIGSDNYPKRSSNSFQVNIPLQDSTRESSGSLSGDNLVTSKPNRSRRSSYAPDNTSFFSIEMDENSDTVESAQTSHGDPLKASSNYNIDELALFLRRHCALEKKISNEKCEESNDGKSNCTPVSAESTISGSTKGHRGPPTRSPSPDGSRVSTASFSQKCSTFGTTYATMSRQIDYLLREEEDSGLTAA